MPELISPAERMLVSFEEAMAEYAAEGRGTADDLTREGRYIREFGTGAGDRDAFAEYVESLRAAARGGDRPAPNGTVPCTYLWYAEGDHFLGRLSLRHTLTPQLRAIGGHIGYTVRPSARRQGHATAMLWAAFRLARARGIDPALVTCDAANTPSRRVIERCGGVLGYQHGTELCFWVPADGAGAGAGAAAAG